MQSFNQLNPAQAERLALLAEECGEVVQAIGKILRHGYESHHPNGGPSNRQALETECGDVLCAIALLTQSLDLDTSRVKAAQEAKALRVGRYLHHTSAP